MIKIHREGKGIVAITATGLLSLVAVSALLLPYQANYFTSLISMGILILVL